MLRIILLFLLFSNPALAEEIPLTCDIEIEFGSIGTGIDSKTYQGIMDRIIDTPDITEMYVTNLGREGERTLCLKVQEEKLDQVYDDLAAQIPAESLKTWTHLRSKNGREFKTRQSEGLVRYDWQRN